LANRAAEMPHRPRQRARPPPPSHRPANRGEGWPPSPRAARSRPRSTGPGGNVAGAGEEPPACLTPPHPAPLSLPPHRPRQRRTIPAGTTSVGRFRRSTPRRPPPAMLGEAPALDDADLTLVPPRPLTAGWRAVAAP